MSIIKVTILEENFQVEWDFDITTHGSPGCAPSLNYPGDPPEGCEFDVEILAIYRPGSKEKLELPDWIKRLLEEHLLSRDDVNEIVQQADQDRDYDPEDYRE